MRKIHYKVGTFGRCLTRCPYKHVYLDSLTNVSSTACQDCEFFDSDDEEKRIVSCRCDEVKEENNEQR